MFRSEYTVALSQYRLFYFSVSNSLHVLHTGCILWYLNINNWQISRSNKQGIPSSELNLCYCGEVFYTNKGHSDKITTSILKNRLTMLTGLFCLDRPKIPGAKSCATKTLGVFEIVFLSKPRGGISWFLYFSFFLQFMMDWLLLLQNYPIITWTSPEDLWNWACISVIETTIPNSKWHWNYYEISSLKLFLVKQIEMIFRLNCSSLQANLCENDSFTIYILHCSITLFPITYWPIPLQGCKKFRS